jgi:hypothetical protein
MTAFGRAGNGPRRQVATHERHSDVRIRRQKADARTAEQFPHEFEPRHVRSPMSRLARLDLVAYDPQRVQDAPGPAGRVEPTCLHLPIHAFCAADVAGHRHLMHGGVHEAHSPSARHWPTEETGEGTAGALSSSRSCGRSAVPRISASGSRSGRRCTDRAVAALARRAVMCCT